MAYHPKTDNPVLMGDFKNIPKKDANTIRVFISSTFTDMSEERNALMKSTFPELHAYFRSNRLDFEIVDMRWGVREEMVLDHMASQLCEKEIAQAQNISNGISFIALLGDKYGSCPLPYTIPSNHYDCFLQVLQASNISTDLLKKWYLLDENDRTKIDEKDREKSLSIYVLASLTDKFKYINSNDPERVELRFQERNQWQVEQAELKTLLQKAATLCCEQRLITKYEKHIYFMAVTEREISLGILLDEEAPKRALCFIRSFEYFKQSDEFANRYADINSDGKLDPQCSLHLNNLKTIKIPDKLPPSNIFRYKIPWHSKGVCPNEETSHKNYLTQLCDDVRRAVIEFSEKRMGTKINPLNVVGDPKWYSDLLHHGEFCLNRASVCVGRFTLQDDCFKVLRKSTLIESKSKFTKKVRKKDSTSVQTFPQKEQNIKLSDCDIDETVQKSTSDETQIFTLDVEETQKNTWDVDEPNKSPLLSHVECHRPTVIYGTSGCGKTSLVAQLSLNFVEIHNFCLCKDLTPMKSENFLKVVRFLGTSPLSCNARNLLESVILQIWAATDCKNKSKSIIGYTFSALCEYFQTLLWSLQSYNGYILIAFDAVDQLNNEYNDYSMNWIPLNFPTNVFLIVSMYEADDASNNSKSASCLSNMRKRLPDETCYVKVNTMTHSVAKSVIKKYAETDKRVLTLVQQNKILTTFKNCQEPMYLKLVYELAKDWKSFTDVSNVKFGKSCKEVIEQLFSKLETQHGRTLVYALKYLTAAREGLTDMEIEDLLSLDDEVLQDVYVYHLPADNRIIRLPPMLWRRIRQQLNEYLAIKEADGKVVINWYHRQFWETAKLHPSNNARVHSIMAEYFSGEWYNQVKPLLLFKGKKAEYDDCSRNVPSMPNCFLNDEPNLRKLNELPYHLIMSFQLDQATDLLTDFDFLLCKLRYTDVKRLTKDFRLYFEQFAPSEFCSAILAYLKQIGTANNEINEIYTIQVIETKIVLQIVQSAVNALRDEIGWTLFAGQIIGRLSGMWLSYPRILKLYNDAKTWIANADFPAIIPRFSCLQQPGSLLITTIFHQVYVPRRYRDSTSGIYFNGLQLFARAQSWNKQDTIEVYDMTNFAEPIQTIKLKLDIISTRFFKNEKYIIIKTYCSTKQRLTKMTVLYDLRTEERVDLPIKDVDHTPIHEIHLSNNERILAVIYFNVCTIFDVMPPNDEIQIRGDLENVSEANYFTASFNMHDTMLLLINETGVIFAYSTTDNKLKWTISMTTERKENTELNFNGFRFQFTSNKIICRGICDHNVGRLFIIDDANGDILTVCEGEMYPLDIILIHKSELWIAAATSSDDILENVKTKPMFMWDIQTGRKLSRIKGNKGSFKSATFLGDDHRYLAFSRKFDPGILIVYIGTPDKPNYIGRLLLKLNGHTKPVTCFVKDPLDNLLITVSPDNNIKVWDVIMILRICRIYEFLATVPQDKTETQTEQSPSKDTDNYFVYKGNLSISLDKQLCHAIIIAVSKDQKYAATGCIFGRIVLFNLVNGDFIVIDGHSKQVKRVNSVIFIDDEYGLSSSKEIVITSASEPNIRVWDPVTGKCLRTLSTGVNVGTMVFDNGCIYAGGLMIDDVSKCTSAIQKYSLLDGSKLFEFQYNGRFVFEYFAISSRESIICSWYKCKIVVFEFDTANRIVERIISPYIPIENEEWDKCSFIVCTSNGNYVLCGCSRFLHIVNLVKTPNAVDDAAILDCTTNVSCIDFTKDDEYALVGCYRSVNLIHISSACQTKQFRVHDDFVESLRMTFSHEYIVTLSKDAFLKVHKFDQEDLEIETSPLVQFSFHCPVRHMVVPENLNFILVGPESAAPLAILTFNDRLIAEIKNRTPNYSISANWTTENPKIASKDYIPSVKIHMKLKDDSVDFYDGDLLSLSLTRDMFQLCKSVSSPFSSISSTDNISCSIS